MTELTAVQSDRNFNQPGAAILCTLGLFGRKGSDAREGVKKLFKCQYCDMTFEEKERMQRHERKAHREKGGDMPNTNPFGF